MQPFHLGLASPVVSPAIHAQAGMAVKPERMQSPSAQHMLADGMPILSSANDLQSLVKKLGATSRTWLRFDSEGGSCLMEADKHAIMQRVGVPARDLRMLDPQLTYPSTILVRDRGLVLNLEHIKAIIGTDEVLLLNSSSEQVAPLVEEMRKRLRRCGAGFDHGDEQPKAVGRHAGMLSDDESAADSDSVMSPGSRQARQTPRSATRGEAVLPLEFRALEVVLEHVCGMLDTQTQELKTGMYQALDALTFKVTSLNLERVRRLKNRMTRLTARVQKVREELESLLDDDEDMADMYLTRKLMPPMSPATLSTPASRRSTRSSKSSKSEQSNAPPDVQELEMLLEVFFTQMDGVYNQLTALREYIDDTEDYINIELDNHRNQLIQLQLVLSTATFTLSITGLVAGVFGMNVPFDWNGSRGVFYPVVGLSFFASFALFFLFTGFLRWKRVLCVG
eukprot:jgi/Chlat1/6202/Chrsp44S05805